MNNKNNQPKNIFRRSFFRKVLTGMGITLTAGAIEEPSVHDSYSKSQRKTLSHNTYRETEHIRAYYESVRKSD